jgi:hypothetical protein
MDRALGKVRIHPYRELKLRGAGRGVVGAFLWAVLVGGVIHFARPLAVSAQDRGSIEVRAVVVDPGPVQETLEAIRTLVRAALEPAHPAWRLADAGSSAEHPAGSWIRVEDGLIRFEDGPIVAVLVREREHVRITVGDLSR